MTQVVPIFPLPGLVFLPGELLPLHVFESRYRALVDHVEAGDGRFAMATLAADGGGERPDVHPWVGYGRVVQLQRMPDGRSYLMLAFEAVGRIEEELEVDTPFRQAKVTLAEPVSAEDYGTVRALRTLALQVVSMLPEFPQREKLFVLESGELVDALARVFLRELELRLEYLAADSAAARIGIMERVLAAALAELSKNEDFD